MAHTVLSLCYSPIKSTQHDTNDNHSILTSIQTTCDTIMSHYRSCHIALSEFAPPPETTAIKIPLMDTTMTTTPPPPPQTTTYIITVSGPHDTVITARMKLLQQCPDEAQLEVKIPMKDLPVIFTDPTCHAAIFETIRKDTQAHISLVLPTTTQQQTSYFESENVVTLCITGLPQHTELARVRLLVALDELVKEFFGYYYYITAVIYLSSITLTLLSIESCRRSFIVKYCLYQGNYII